MSGGHRDPGAQPERTRLAWRRTTLSFALVVVLAARGLVTADGGLALLHLSELCLFFLCHHSALTLISPLRRPRRVGCV